MPPNAIISPAPKTAREREIAREAFKLGLCTWLPDDGDNGRYAPIGSIDDVEPSVADVLARRAFPALKITKPREVAIGLNTYRVADGHLEYLGYNGEWHVSGAALDAFLGDPQWATQLADLLTNPTEEVDADA